MRRTTLTGAVCALAAACGVVSNAHAADQGDIYFEAAFGANASSSAKVHSEFNFGYLPVDSIGFGLSYVQYYSLVPHFKDEEGSQVGLEGRWFLEPVEAYIAAGAFMQSSTTRGFFQLGVNYLVALTPSISLKVDARTRLVFPRFWAPYVSVGGRLLF